MRRAGVLSIEAGASRVAAFARRRWPPLLLLLAWMLSALLIWPLGEFSIVDDWAFTLPVKWLVEDGVLQFTHWPAMTLVTQVVAGALWSEVFGFSQLNLRLLVVAFAGAALVFAYLIARACGLSKPTALVVAALPLASPIFAAMSTSFMTDTPYLAMTLATTYALIRVLADGPRWPRWFAAGALLLAASIFLRQTGVAMALAFVVADVCANGLRARTLLRSAALVAFAAGLVPLASSMMVDLTGGAKAYSGVLGGIGVFVGDLLRFESRPVWYFAATAFWGAIYVGMFAAPLGVGVLAHRIAAGRISLASEGAIAALAAVLLVALRLTGRGFPRGHVLLEHGISPRLIWPYDEFASGDGFSWPLAALSALGLAFLIVEASKGAAAALGGVRIRAERLRLGRVLLVAAVAMLTYLPYCVYYASWYDRYMLVTAAAGAISVAAFRPQADREFAAAAPLVALCVAVGALWSAALARDYFVWHRAREALVERAMSQYGLSADEIDGGQERNNYQAFIASARESAPTRLIDASNRAYQLSKTEKTGYEVLEIVDPPQIFPSPHARIILLRKTELPAE